MRGNGKYALFSVHTVKTIIDNPVYVGKIAYGHRLIERVTDNNEEVEKIRRLKNYEYRLYDGKHEAIIDEELWELAQEKRRNTSIRYEKTHSLDHEHILSGILKCPICGAPMYGTVNRKKKKDGSGEYYKYAWYYVCKHRKLKDGQKCTYRMQLPQGSNIQEMINNISIKLLNWISYDDISSYLSSACKFISHIKYLCNKRLAICEYEI